MEHCLKYLGLARTAFLSATIFPVQSEVLRISFSTKRVVAATTVMGSIEGSHSILLRYKVTGVKLRGRTNVISGAG